MGLSKVAVTGRKASEPATAKYSRLTRFRNQNGPKERFVPVAVSSCSLARFSRISGACQTNNSGGGGVLHYVVLVIQEVTQRRK